MYPNSKVNILYIFLDILFVSASVTIIILVKPSFNFNGFNNQYLYVYAVFMGLWILASLSSNKFKTTSNMSIKKIFSSILVCNFFILGMVTILIFIFQITSISRFLIFGTITITTLLEIITGTFYYSVHNSPFMIEWMGGDVLNGNSELNNDYRNNKSQSLTSSYLLQDVKYLQNGITQETSLTVSNWISDNIDLFSTFTIILSTTTRFNVECLASDHFNVLVNLKRINDIQRINKFFETVNSKLPIGGVFIGSGETYQLRKSRILKKYPVLLNYTIYSFDFIYRRVFPKLRLTNKIYFLLSQGKNRVLSRTEILGRLYSCGFEVIEEKNIENLMYWVAKKIKSPAFDDHPTYGLLIRLRRIGKDGREFDVYKLRTMHAYSEYIQNYLYDKNHLDDGGKFKNDFRITTLGRFFRKIWLDELPMLINVMKGDMKIVGVRPLSPHYFKLYSDDIQKKRIRVKPGLIPPYYAQFPTPLSLEEVQQNELEYLQNYEKHPLKTDLRYFFKAMCNILFKGARSK